MSHHPPGLVAIPAMAWLWTEAAKALLKLRVPPRSSIIFENGGTTIAEKRNHLARVAMDHPTAGMEWVLFCDSDMTPPKDAALRLLSHGKDVVGARCYGRSAPYSLKARPLDGTDPSEGLHEAEYVGTGFMLVRRPVFEVVPFPWFEHLEQGRSEDVYFCEKAREAGFKVWLDASTPVGHLGVVGVSPDNVDALREVPA